MAYTVHRAYVTDEQWARFAQACAREGLSIEQGFSVAAVKYALLGSPPIGPYPFPSLTKAPRNRRINIRIPQELRDDMLSAADSFGHTLASATSIAMLLYADMSEVGRREPGG